MSLQTRDEGNILIVYFTDAKILDEAKIQQVGAELMKCKDQALGGRMLLNFRNVGFMSSAMIGKIILLNSKCKEGKIDLRICEISDNVMEVFKLMRLGKILNIQKTEQAAIESFDKRGFFG